MTDLARLKLAEARNELMSAARIIEKLLFWARPSSEVPTVVSLREMLEDLHEIVAEKLVEGQIRFQLASADDVPPAYVAPDRIKMAILDVFVNAQAAMPDGGVLSASIRGIPGRDAVEVSISDTGRGMTEGQVQKIFHHANVAGPEAGGSGLGLYLAQKIITAAGGNIRCRSKLGSGTTLTIELPTMKES
jgi:signal transduction histidine kinase